MVNILHYLPVNNIFVILPNLDLIRRQPAVDVARTQLIPALKKTARQIPDLGVVPIIQGKVRLGQQGCGAVKIVALVSFAVEFAVVGRQSPVSFGRAARQRLAWLLQTPCEFSS